MGSSSDIKDLLRERVAAKYTIDDLKETGKKIRETAPIESLAAVSKIDRDPVQFINSVEQNLTESLLPMRHQRMGASQAAFFRGTAELMAYDLRQGEKSGINLLIDGDAHLQNFGFYASPERNLLFDLNDFDEAQINSFEFDIKRLLTSVYLLGDQQGFEADKLDELVQTDASIYRKTLRDLFKLGALDRFYQSTEVKHLMQEIPGAEDSQLLAKFVKKATKRNNDSVVKKYTLTTDDGHMRFKDDPPSSVRLDQATYQAIYDGFTQYRKTTRADILVLLSQYRITDIIHHSVGIGSFGTNCYLVLLSGLGGGHIVLQVKEALPPRQELLPHTERMTLQQEVSQGQRIIAAQMILQKASDPFLGWFNVGDKSYYVRQFRDMKGSVDLEELNFTEFQYYTQITAYLLAMAHAQTPQAAVVTGYLDKHFDSAVQRWSKWYLNQVKADYSAFLRAVDTHLLA
ncbi:DUF2252 domain-containing protein [Lacticaseibacillus zeae]|uniref:DUF2252 domain-containing protein n=1 Tax=Lacticaseibacillus zeae subsp. silagei TaxID=3068307 RepID=A0ABD7ZC97_LACZE|nr:MULTISPECIES: DUF2252 domain-containing protein [Lacticaseibacillus]MDE3316916.1 DUF2252 domain-containing protein [Lacticaseibacillus zeae]OFR98733.1 hypothetical protein HMPREF2861_05640 [Lactobacillus sp. HMSC068F07]WLV84548.1 DUF2252 domain-containing protein [Lacticaseibacillus sp. NCIMB 15475]WLV87304.1 DUF2252 domain-containing protein [Lacticaseibacillus sp. NCIMB 15474]